MSDNEKIFDIDMDQFMRDRRVALLSMDKAVIIAYMERYGVTVPGNDQVFWAGVHMGRTGARDLPMGERVKSKQWLNKRGLRSLDEGEVPNG